MQKKPECIHQEIHENSQIAIYQKDDTISCVLLEGKKPVERLVRCGSCCRRLDIVTGTVRQIVPPLQAVFIEIGDVHDAFLPLKEAPSSVKPGQPVIVQISRQTPSYKGHKVTTAIQIPGPFAVFSSNGKHLKRSKLKGYDKAEQENLYERDLQRLQHQWQNIRQNAFEGTIPRLLLGCGDPVYRAIIDWVDNKTTRIQTDDLEIYRELEKWIRILQPEKLSLLHLTVPTDSFGLAEILALTDLDKLIRQKKVWLPGGGTIVIEQTEAFTSIDVNSGRDIKGRSDQSLRIRTNDEAIVEIVRQLRLRNTSGMVVIDFLRLKNPEDQERLNNRFRQELNLDRAKTKLFGFTGMGLFELIRTAL